MFGLFKKTYRFRIYFVKDNESLYVLRGNSPIKMLGYLSGYYEEQQVPAAGWECHFYSAATKQFFTLDPEHFSNPENILSDRLFASLTEIDSRWEFIREPELQFLDLKQKKEIEIDSPRISDSLLNDIYNNKERRNTFFSVMDSIFVKN